MKYMNVKFENIIDFGFGIIEIGDLTLNYF